MARYQLLPDLTPDEYAELRDDIAENGFRVPVDVDEAGPRTNALTAFGTSAGSWVMAEIMPSTIACYWHVAIVKHGGSIIFTKQAIAGSRLNHYLQRLGVTDAHFKVTSREPSAHNPWDSDQSRSMGSDTRAVYFIQSVDGGPIKIGVSRDPVARLASIQLMSPMRLRIIGVIPEGGRRTEQQLHERFASGRLHGEWFRPSTSLKYYIAELNGGAA
ncbi:MAG: GIY-YIG nuclease family protein [Nocardioidaceae bacterium]